jgi:hypothetical protein
MNTKSMGMILNWFNPLHMFIINFPFHFNITSPHQSPPKGSGEGDITLHYINYMMSQMLNGKKNRLKWVGYVMQMDNNQITKRMFNARPEVKRGTGRPKLR